MKRFIPLLLIMLGCGSSDVSETKYATWSFGKPRINAFSVLTQVYNAGGTIDFSLQYRGIYPSYEQDQAMRQNIARALREWTSALDPSEYPYRVPEVRIGPTGSHTIIVDASVTRSYALPEQKQMVLSGQYVNQYDPYAYRVILHEMGHFVGLADTYTEPGFQQPINQPQGIMNNVYSFDRLQADDILGVRSLWNYLRGKGPFCQNGYQVGGAYENRNQIAFCVPG